MMSMPVIMLIGLFVAGGGTLMSIQIAEAQYIDNNNTGTSLGNPFFLEKGMIIGQRVLSINPLQIEFTVLAKQLMGTLMQQTQVRLLVLNLTEYFIQKDNDSL